MTKRAWYGLNKETNPLGFGCWQISGTHSIDGRPNGWGEINEKEAIKILSTAIESGIDFFDTAQAYNNGKSEELLGKAIRQTSDHVVVCSKIALTDQETIEHSLSGYFEERVEKSLKHLGTDHLDILLIHNPPDNINWKEFNSSILSDLQTKGKIGTFGVSTRGLNAAKNVVEAKFGTVVEWVFNFFERRPVTELFPLIEQNKFNFIARSPLSRGLINPNYLNAYPRFNSDEFRSTLPKDWVEWALSALKKIHSKGVPADELVKQALLYCLQYETVTSAIVGVRTIEQLNDLLKISSSANISDFTKHNFLDGIPECFPGWN